MVLLWGLVIAGIVWVVREIGSSKTKQTRLDEAPLSILDRRLADGTISPDDYRERRTILEDQKAQPTD